MNKGLAESKLDDGWQGFYKRMAGNYEDVVYEDFKRRYAINHKSDQVKLKETIPKKLYQIISGKRSVFYTKALVRELLTLHRRWVLRYYYHFRSVNPGYNTPYVFVPLHVQPERTSIPQGGVFGQQLLMIEMLSRALPDGWLLYVKEHPVQLYDRPVFKFFRTSAFYREVLRFPNVRLIPARISSRKLVDHCRAVASVTSTVCWEGLFQSKPALVFGHEWYNFCEGVFHIPDEDACIKAMTRIRNGFTVDQNRLQACLLAIQEQGIPRTANRKCPENTGVEVDRFQGWAAAIAEQIDEYGRVLDLDTDAGERVRDIP